ncbi:amidase [Devosia sp. FKR38]|uniref:amidase n=1 Tax=Devosia sp. FKR38 TaxID=2562312 RepID=UPI0010C105A3|nr:amidase [Devosia sp. FKR38]
MGGEIWTWDSVATATAIKAGVISSREATRSVIDRMQAVNPAVNAVVEELEAEALAAADAADAARARGDALGPLHGVPITTKVNVDMVGHATTHGVVAFKDAMAMADSASVANLRQGGAVIVGRTNIPTFSYRWFSSNALYGETRNPWGATLSPGGSSGGAAVASAIGIGSIAHGNDVAGSLRLPAGACGIYGMRPTVGRLPSYNPAQGAEKSLCLQIAATEGVLARSVRDIAVGLTVLEHYDHRDPCAVPPLAPQPGLDQPCRVALFTGEAEFGTHPEVAAVLRRAAGWLEDAGYIVEEVAPPRLAEMAELWMALLYAECSGKVREFMLSVGDDAFRRAFHDTAGNLPVYDAAGEHDAWERRMTILREWQAFFASYPILLVPTAFQPTFPLQHDQNGLATMATIMQAFTPLSATAGLALPAISVPAGMAQDAPAGVQIIAARFMDERCLAAARVLEARIGPTAPIDPVRD